MRGVGERIGWDERYLDIRVRCDECRQMACEQVPLQAVVRLGMEGVRFSRLRVRRTLAGRECAHVTTELFDYPGLRELVEHIQATQGMPVIPHCAVCGHPVDRFTQHEDAATEETVLTAQCHGQSEETRLTRAHQIEAPRHLVAPRIAFAPKTPPALA